MVRQNIEILSPSGYAALLHLKFMGASQTRITYPEEWQQAYIAEGLTPADPVFNWCFGHTGSIR